MTTLTNPQKTTPLKALRGSALIAIIAAILIFSVLAASLIPLISSSSRQAAITALSDKAYLLAESGYRLLESRYRNAGPAEPDKNAAIEDMDGGNFTLADDEGQFHLRVYSYFYEITGDANATSTQITANPPGSLPVDNTLDGDEVQVSTGASLLSIDGQLYTVNNASPATFIQDGNITFTVDPLVNAVQDGTIAYPAARVRNAVGSLQTGGTLPYNSGEGALFPLRNGRFILDGSIVLDYRYNNRTSNQFEGVSDPNQASMGFPVAAGASMVLTNYARVHSLGIVGSATAGTDREVIYYGALPLSASSAPTRTMEDNFDDTDTVPDNWDVTAPGTTGVDIAEVDGNQAMRIRTADDDASLVGLKSSVTENIFNAYRRASGGYMSYDAQVKVGFYDTFYGPIDIANPVRANVNAGLSFRLNTVTSNTDYNGYGISFLYNGDLSLPAGITPPEVSNEPAIVLWSQTGGGTSRNWLAYKKMLSPVYPVPVEPPNSFDDVINDWTASGTQWTVVPSSGRDNSQAWQFDGYYSATLISPVISLACPTNIDTCSEAPKMFLRFWSTYSESPRRRLNLILNGEEVRNNVPILRGPSDNGWIPYSYEITDNINNTLQIQFEMAPSFYTHEWIIDDVEILFQWPAQNSTLAVRLQEATKVDFDHGGTVAFEIGDRVYGASGTIGTIISTPMMSNADWAGGNATGTLLLNNVSANPQFQSNDLIVAIGNSNKTAQVSNNTTFAKTNIIKAYYASETGNPSGNGDLLDAVILAYPRRSSGGSLEWFPEEGESLTPEQDYFRLIKWDAVHSDVSPIPDLFGGINAIDNVILSHHHADLQTPPTSSALGLPELGLHAYGTGTTNIYYDDFGFKLVFPPTGLYPTPLQQ